MISEEQFNTLRTLRDVGTLSWTDVVHRAATIGYQNAIDQHATAQSEARQAEEEKQKFLDNAMIALLANHPVGVVVQIANTLWQNREADRLGRIS